MQIKVEKLNLVKLSCIYLVYEGLWLQAPTPFSIPRGAIQRNARNSWSNICRYGSTPTSRELQLLIYNNNNKIAPHTSLLQTHHQLRQRFENPSSSS